MEKPGSTADIWNEFKDEILLEINQTRHSLDENSLMLDQSQKELVKLAQKNQVISAHLQQVQMHFDTMPMGDVKAAYLAAMDSQQRLLVMRTQVEKLKSDQAGLQKLLSYLEKMQKIIFDNPTQSKDSLANEKSALVESMINSQETVRQKLANLMHDGPAQTLSNFMIRVEIVSRLLDLDVNKAKEELSSLKTEAVDTFSAIKTFITELRPMTLDDLGLVPALKRYIESFKTQNNIDVNLAVKGQERKLEPYIEVMVFRAVQELMGNSLEYNRGQPARVNVNVLIEFDDAGVKVSVSDNGIGFGTDQLKQSKGLGLKLIRERVEMLGGSMEVDAFAGQGCNVSFTVPCLEVFDFSRAQPGVEAGQ